jgi:hypothetical protein
MLHKQAHSQAIGLRLLLMALMVLFAFSKMIREPLWAADIGAISELNGFAKVVRDKELGAELALGIQSLDNVQTSNGRMAITFEDDSRVKLTEHSELIIDEYIYDPNPSKSKMTIKFASGTARFITGQLGKIDKRNITLSTPTANIAIRGTDFTCTVDEFGKSLIILLPDANGISSGEIVVSTGIGSVTLNKPYQATTVAMFEQAPSSPAILNLTLDMIDNMLIVTPPKSVELVEEVQTVVKANPYLDFSGLDVDFLADDFLEEDPEFEFSELDINYLDVNFLEDMLNILDALGIAAEEDKLKQATGINITGTELGQDKDTQITTLITGQIVSLRRFVGHSVRLDVEASNAYTVILMQEGVERIVKVNGGSDSTIRILQGS